MSRTWALGPLVGTALTMPIFDGGRNRANLDRSYAALEESVAGVQRNVNGDYDATWLQLTEEYRAHVITTIPGGVRR